ncbi:MAG: nucleotidyl transferase AbiEii/AbiGii toxin family protein [Proteobacteria bacterium]|nr:nucleotidyl transferase AbiEii/AbiGii toxin family protein [Pseudomonadota bacterium]
MADFSESFHKTTKLLLQILPFIGEETNFCLKGGTAINFFIHDMPRLSVDIDLAYLPISSRELTIQDINQTLSKISKNIQKKMPELKVLTTKNNSDNDISKISVQNRDIIVKIETNSTFRGCLYPTELRELCQTAQNTFEIFLETNVVGLPDLYAGKLCATLDRQHPRDLFDVKILLETIGITDDIRRAFVVYLCGDRRPMHELLSPNIKKQEKVFQEEFIGMLRQEISYAELAGLALEISNILRETLTTNEKQFMLSLAAGEPEWEHIDIPHISTLPALQWKLLNIQKMDSKKRDASVKALEDIL